MSRWKSTPSVSQAQKGRNVAQTHETRPRQEPRSRRAVQRRQKASQTGAPEALMQGRGEALNPTAVLQLQTAAGNAAVSAALDKRAAGQLAVPLVQRQGGAVAEHSAPGQRAKIHGPSVTSLIEVEAPQLLPLIPPAQIERMQTRFDNRATNADITRRLKEAQAQERAESYSIGTYNQSYSPHAEAWARKTDHLRSQFVDDPEGPDELTVLTAAILDPAILEAPTEDAEAEAPFRSSVYKELSGTPLSTVYIDTSALSALERSKLNDEGPTTKLDVFLRCGRIKLPHTKGKVTFADLTEKAGSPFAKRYAEEVTNRPAIAELRKATLDLDEAVNNGKGAHEALIEAGVAHPWVKRVAEFLGGPSVGDYMALMRDIKKHPEKGTYEERRGELEAPEPPLEIWSEPKQQLDHVIGLLGHRQVKSALITLMLAEKMVHVTLDRFERYHKKVMKGAGTGLAMLQVAKAAGKAAAAWLVGPGATSLGMELGLTTKAAAAGVYSFAQGAGGNVGAYLYAPAEMKDWGKIGKEAGIEAAMELVGGTLEEKFKATLDTRFAHHLEGYPKEIADKALEAATKATAAVYKAPTEAVLKHIAVGGKLPASGDELADMILDEALKEGTFGLGKLAEKVGKSKKKGEGEGGE